MGGSPEFEAANGGNKHFVFKERGGGPPYPFQDQQHGCSIVSFVSGPHKVDIPCIRLRSWWDYLLRVRPRPTFLLGRFRSGSMSQFNLQQSMPPPCHRTMFQKDDWHLFCDVAHCFCMHTICVGKENLFPTLLDALKTFRLFYDFSSNTVCSWKPV